MRFHATNVCRFDLTGSFNGAGTLGFGPSPLNMNDLSASND